MLVLTRSALPVARHSWVNRIFAAIRREPGTTHKNQFFVGDLNFNYLSFFLIVAPILAYIVASAQRRYIGQDVETEDKITGMANTIGIAGLIALSFFLIPVSRHSVLLSALGWSPVHALRLHVWAGFFSFVCIFFHGLLYVVDMFAYQEGSVADQVIPNNECWAIRDPEEGELSKECELEWYNFTGLIAFVFVAILCATSLNYVRRRWYRIFYICHTTCGTGMLVMTIFHWNPAAYYILPSIVYYLASTTPVLVQAVASRFRGGVKIIKVVTLHDAGGCTEVRIQTNANANQALDDQPCAYVKLCVPNISLVWHPFTVYKHHDDPTTVRFLFRPLGPFTKQLEASLLASPPPVTILDGFYRGGNRVEEALQHDHVTILAGGVAITPFLSMIPSLLIKIGSLEKDSPLKSITVIWSCREEGLYRFVFNEYISKYGDLIDAASRKGLLFQFKVYHTGTQASKILGFPIKEGSSDTDAEEVLDSTDAFKESVSHDSDVSSSSSVGEDTPAPMVGKSTTNPIADSMDIASVGHPMEIARMMPGRFSSLAWNLPAFLAFSGMIWFGYWLIVHWYNREHVLNDVLTRSFGNLCAIAAAIGVAVLVECTGLHAWKYWPNAHADNFAISEYVKAVDGGSADLSMDSAIVHVTGRPTGKDVVETAAAADSPGIFMCGPTAMIHAVKSEASKENSLLGLTRYCLYEEAFEM